MAQGSSTGVSQLKLPVTARNASLAEALVAAQGDLSSTALNPANLATLKDLEIILSHTEWIQDIQSEHLTIGYPTRLGTFAFSVSSTNTGNIEVREIPGPPLATFTARSASLQASYATALAPTIDAGISAKFLYDKLYVEEATGVALDAGLLYHPPVEGLVFGASVANAGTMNAYVQQSTDLPLLARVGGSFKTSYDDFAFMLASQFTIEKRSQTDKLHFGFEASYKQRLALRLGYQSGYDSRSIAAGLGATYEWVNVDYAYVPFSLNLGNAHLFTIGFRL